MSTGVPPSGSGGYGLPEEAFATALASLAAIGPRGLRALLAKDPPSVAWARVRDGHPDDQGGEWRSSAARIDPVGLWATCRRLGVQVAVLGSDRYPQALAGDPEAPAVLFWLGDAAVLGGHRRVTVVGTRSATRYGLGVAAQLGADLAAAGVVVVSGLAMGIDGAAHEGALAGWQAAGVLGAPPVGVVAGAVEQPYPRRHSRLWWKVVGSGAIFSEAPVGTSGPPRWRFPQRNRLLAALAHLVVVVECHQTGGSLHTAQAALDRGVRVGVVPGSVRSPASAGTNDLLAAGGLVVRDAADVLMALSPGDAQPVVPKRLRAATGARPARRRPASSPAAPGASPPRPAGSDDVVGLRAAATIAEGTTVATTSASPERRVLAAIGWEACPLEQVLGRSGLSLAEASATLERLQVAGRVRGEGGWWERT